MSEHKRPTSFSTQDFLIYQQEQKATKHIEKMVAESASVDFAVLERVRALVDKVKNPAQRLEQKILTKLAQEDEDVFALLERCKQGQQTLSKALQHLRQQKEVSNALENALKPLVPDFDTNQKELWKTILNSQYLEDIEAAMQLLSESLSSPDTLWTMVVRDGSLPRFVIETTLKNGATVTFMESIGFWIDVQQTLSELDRLLVNEPDKKKRRLVRARVLTQAVESRSHMISPAVLEDLIEERYDETDPWIANTVFNTFLKLEDEVIKNERKLTPTQKRLLAVSLAVMLGVAVTLAGGEELQSKVKTTLFPPRNPAVQTQEAPTLVPPTATSTPTSTSTPEPTRPIGTGVPIETTGGPPIEVPQNSQQSQSGSENTPASQQNDPNAPPRSEQYSSPENSGDLPQGNVWKIQGEIPPGYLRTQTASEFYTNPIWRMNRNGGVTRNLPRSSDEETTVLVSDFTISEPGSYPIPMPYEGYSVVSIDLGEGQYSITVSPQNIVTLRINSLEHPSKVRVGLGHSSANVTDEGNYYDTETRALVGEVSQLPVEAQELLREVQNLPVPQRAELITSFVQNYFTYSLNPRYSDYARVEVEQGAFVRRLFSLPYGDCDVVNTVNVALLRAAGIPARMAYGYMNSSGLLGADQTTLDKGESHGWAEYFDGTEWVNADATPTKVDEYTREKLNQRNNVSVNYEVVELNNFGEEMKLSLLSLMDWLRVYGTGTGVLASIALYIAALVQLNYVRSRHQKRTDEAESLLMPLRGKGGIADMERKFLSELVDEHLNLTNPDKYRGTDATFLSYGALIPEFIGQRMRARRLKKTESSIESKDPRYLEKMNFFDYVQETLDMDPVKLSERIVEHNQEGNWNTYLHQFTQLFYDKANNLFESYYFIPKGFRYIGDEEAMVAIAERSPSLSDYINTVVKQFYDAYLVDYKKRQKQLKDKQKKARLPKKAQILESPVSLQAFTAGLLDEFSMLVPFYEHLKQTKDVMKLRAQLIKNGKLSETAAYPPVDPSR